MQAVGFIRAEVQRLVRVLDVHAEVVHSARQHVQPLQQRRGVGRVGRRVLKAVGVPAHECRCNPLLALWHPAPHSLQSTERRAHDVPERRQACAPENGSLEEVAAAPRDPDGKLLRVHVQNPSAGHLQRKYQVLPSARASSVTTCMGFRLFMQLKQRDEAIKGTW